MWGCRSLRCLPWAEASFVFIRQSHENDEFVERTQLVSVFVFLVYFFGVWCIGAGGLA